MEDPSEKHSFHVQFPPLRVGSSTPCARSADTIRTTIWSQRIPSWPLLPYCSKQEGTEVKTHFIHLDMWSTKKSIAKKHLAAKLWITSKPHWFVIQYSKAFWIITCHLLDAFIQSLHTQYCGQSPQEHFGVKCLRDTTTCWLQWGLNLCSPDLRTNTLSTAPQLPYIHNRQLWKIVQLT